MLLALLALPLSTLRSSSPCATWAAPLSGVCAGSATGFPRTAPTCLRAVGVDALPCPGGQVACGGRQHGSPSRIEMWSLVCNLLETARRPPALCARSSSARWRAFGGLPDCAWVCQPQKKGQRAHLWQHRVREEAILQPALRPRLRRPPRRGSPKCPAIGSAQ